MKKIKARLILSLILISTQAFSQEKKNIKYDFACFDNDNASAITNTMSRIGSVFWDIAKEDLTAKEEEEYGGKFLQSARKEYKFIGNGNEYMRVGSLCLRLVVRKNELPAAMASSASASDMVLRERYTCRIATNLN